MGGSTAAAEPTSTAAPGSPDHGTATAASGAAAAPAASAGAGVEAPAVLLAKLQRLEVERRGLIDQVDDLRQQIKVEQQEKGGMRDKIQQVRGRGGRGGGRGLWTTYSRPGEV